MIYAVEFVVALHLTNNLDDLVEVDEAQDCQTTKGVYLKCEIGLSDYW